MYRVLVELALPQELPKKESLNGTLKLIIRKKTYGYEIDIGTENASLILDEIQNRYGNVPVRVVKEQEILEHPTEEDIKEVITKSAELFEQERYWESHVLLETVWRNSTGKMRVFLQSLIILAASQVHFQMGDLEIAETQYKRAHAGLAGNGIAEKYKISIPGDFTYPVRVK